MSQIIARVVIDLDEAQTERADFTTSEITVHATSTMVMNAMPFSESELANTEQHQLLL